MRTILFSEIPGGNEAFTGRPIHSCIKDIVDFVHDWANANNYNILNYTMFPFDPSIGKYDMIITYESK